MVCPVGMRALALFAPVVGAIMFVESPLAQNPPPPPTTNQSLPSETPPSFRPVTDSFDYTRRDLMIPMRDGVKLRTIVLVPKGAKGAPILLTRTPYDAGALTGHARSSHLGPILSGYDNATDVIVEGGYIRVVQDIRGKHGSEGDYVMSRPLRGALNPTPVDHSTDTYDTIAWLVKNVPETNGRVGILGISYDGFLPLMALVNPHPALKVAVPMNPMVDGWRGDDWFHNGAFRQQMMAFLYDQEASRASDTKWWTSHFDEYDMFMQAGSAGELGLRRGSTDRLLAQDCRAPELRRVLARTGDGPDPRGAAVECAGDARTQPLGSGRHLRRDRRLQGAGAEGRRQRQGVPGHGSVASWAGDRRWKHARRAEFSQRHGVVFPTGDSRPVSLAIPERRRAEGGRASRRRLRNGHERLAAPAGLAGWMYQRLRSQANTALRDCRPQGWFLRAQGRRPRV